MSINPVVSIALPVFNSEKTLAEAIISVLRQSFSDWELLVMDDGSRDRTLEIVNSFSDSRIQVSSDGIHRGLPGQLNRAVARARGKYLARMDADDISYPERLRKQLAFLESHPEVDLVGTWVTVFRSNGTLLGARRAPTEHAAICARPWAGFPMAHPTWMGRIQWFRTNPYKEDAVRMEDRELLVRTYRHSRFAVMPEVLLGYREDSLSFRKLFVARKNTCKMAIDHGIRERKFAFAFTMVAGQLARMALEAVVLPAGLDYKILRNRALPPTMEERDAWNKTWAALTGHQAIEAVSDGCKA